MRRRNSHQIDRRTLRFTGPLPSLLQSVANGGPLYVHAKNWLAELASIVPLSGMVTDENDSTVFFPEEGLHLSLAAVEAVHGVALDYQTGQALALEIAMCGEPQSLSVVAVPDISDTGHFTRCLNQQPAEILQEEEYRRWRDGFLVRPALCPCCEAAAHERRAFRERNPLARILQHAVENELDLRCGIISPSMGFTIWLRPQKLEISNGVLGLIAGDGRSLLEVDTGICHMLRVVCRLVDDEPFTEILLYDSFGDVHLTLSGRGWDKEAVWRGLCC